MSSQDVIFGPRKSKMTNSMPGESGGGGSESGSGSGTGDLFVVRNLTFLFVCLFVWQFV